MSNICALSMSFHKVNGPMGLGMLILDPKILSKYDIKSEIGGSQQNSLRGGTENVPAIAGGLQALKTIFPNRVAKNKRLLKLRDNVVKMLSSIAPIGKYENYIKGKVSRNEIVILGSDNTLVNTLMISFAKNTGTAFCNTKLKKCLYKNNIIVSVGSACSTSSDKASHVLSAICAPTVIKAGVIRISMSDYTTKKELDEFIKCLIKCLLNQKFI
jgi:cysteine desulfurase